VYMCMGICTHLPAYPPTYRKQQQQQKQLQH
jgi:hypothetical protein